MINKNKDNYNLLQFKNITVRNHLPDQKATKRTGRKAVNAKINHKGPNLKAIFIEDIKRGNQGKLLTLVMLNKNQNMIIFLVPQLEAFSHKLIEA